MLQKINITNYKKFDNFTLDNLKQFNLIVGKNNAGKTSLLQAIFGAGCGANIFPLIHHCFLPQQKNTSELEDFLEKICSSFRDHTNLNCTFDIQTMDSQQVVFKHEFKPSSQLYKQLYSDDLNDYQLFNEHLQNNLNTQQGFIIMNGNPMSMKNFCVGSWTTTEIQNNLPKQYPAINISLPNAPMMLPEYVNPFKPMVFHHTQSHLEYNSTAGIYNILKRQGDDAFQNFVDEFNRSFPEIDKIDYIPYVSGVPRAVLLRNALTKQLLPIYQFGEGVQRWFYLLGTLLLHRHSIHCIDEVETGFHVSMQEHFIENLIHHSEKHQNQIFMTTHSLEFLDHFLNVAKSKGDEFLTNQVNIITLNQINRVDKVKLTQRALNGSEALKRRETLNMELR